MADDEIKFQILKQIPSEKSTVKEQYEATEAIFKILNEQLLIQRVVNWLPTIIEIDFDGHLKCQIETTDKAPTILKAVNGYGQPVDCNKDKIRITEI